MQTEQLRRETAARMMREGYQKPQAERMAAVMYPEEPQPAVAQAPEAKQETNGQATAEEVQASNAEVRAWARSKGIPVNPRGSVKADVREKYQRAHRPRRSRASSKA